jgi:hypothetical protein
MSLVPEEHQPLCENCGYILQGLPSDARCPECGRAVAESLDPFLRQPPPWEQHPSPWTFLATSARVLLRPSQFFRYFATRTDSRWSRLFAFFWRGACSLLLAWAISDHLLWAFKFSNLPFADQLLAYAPLRLLLLSVVVPYFAVVWAYLFLAGTTWLAVRLTVWEARYRNLRLPRIAVERALRYHSVHLAPPSLDRKSVV